MLACGRYSALVFVNRWGKKYLPSRNSELRKRENKQPHGSLGNVRSSVMDVRPEGEGFKENAHPATGARPHDFSTLLYCLCL